MLWSLIQEHIEVSGASIRRADLGSADVDGYFLFAE